jgi:hypothetical protein
MLVHKLVYAIAFQSELALEKIGKVEILFVCMSQQRKYGKVI